MRILLAVQVDAFAWAFGRRVDNLETQMGRHADQSTGREFQLSGFVFDVSEPVHVELEDLGSVLHTQPVTSAKVLIHTDSKFGHSTNVPWPGCCTHGVSGGLPEGQEQLVLRAA